MNTFLAIVDSKLLKSLPKTYTGAPIGVQCLTWKYKKKPKQDNCGGCFEAFTH